MPVEEHVSIMAPLKPRFIHNDVTNKLIRDLPEDFGCSLDDTSQDVPRLRMVTSDADLTSGVGYAHHMHRDTWYPKTTLSEPVILRQNDAEWRPELGHS